MEEFEGFEKRYSIKEVAEQTGIKEGTLRKYENDYSLKIARESDNRRYYTEAEIDVFKQIKHMKEHGCTITMIREFLSKSVVAREQVEKSLELVPIDKYTGKDFMELLKRRDEELLSTVLGQMETVVENIVEAKVEQALSKHREEMKGENQKLLNKIDDMRTEMQNRNNRGFFNKIFKGNK